jgi:hypothetical protein
VREERWRGSGWRWGAEGAGPRARPTRGEEKERGERRGASAHGPGQLSARERKEREGKELGLGRREKGLAQGEEGKLVGCLL